jgi:O-acetyl-ADP-ribose deacetylase (regulator of RNase III)
MSELDEIGGDLRADTSLEKEESDAKTRKEDHAVFARAANLLEGFDLSPATVEFILRGIQRAPQTLKGSDTAQMRVRQITSRRRETQPLRMSQALRESRESSHLTLERASYLLRTSVGKVERIEQGEVDDLVGLESDAVADYVRSIRIDPADLLRAVFRDSLTEVAGNRVAHSSDRADRDRRWILDFLSALGRPTTESASSVRWKWTNRSVTQFAHTADPVEEMRARAQAVAIAAKDAGWSGPPFDPIKLAESMGLEVVPNVSVKDARTVPTTSGVRIEFNPNRPRPRIRYSIAHEIGHTLFPDCRAYVRNRASYHELRGDDWQIESLCNIAAAEFLMPEGSLSKMAGLEPGIDSALAVREEFQVSVEAALIRLVRSWTGSCAMFVASRPADSQTGQYRVDYVMGSPSWRVLIPKGATLPPKSLAEECTAVGFTAKGAETWFESTPKFRIECVAIAPYPGNQYPRVAGILKEFGRSRDSRLLTYLVGDATNTRGDDPKVIAHIINDATANWGGAGFAQFVRQRWPHVQQEFKSWASTNPKQFALGHVHATEVQTNLWIAHMIAQHGYGPSLKPRIRYEALQTCLRQTADLAMQLKASVHMPRIGTGQARGDWSVIEDLVKAELSARDIRVTVYDPAGSNPALRAPTTPTGETS